MARIFQGLVTGADRVFVLEGISELKSKATWEERHLHPLEVGDATNPAPTTLAQRETIAAVSRCSGFFDYRALLRASLTTQPRKLPEQLFDLFVESLLAGFRVRTHGGEQTIGRLWSDAVKAKPAYRYAKVMRRANSAVDDFDRAFRPFLAQITEKANAFLDYFPDHRLRIVNLDYRGSSYAKATKELTGKAIFPEIEFNGKTFQGDDRHQEFLNEARLTALALSVFLAAVALADSNPTDPEPLRLLVLDDVLTDGGPLRIGFRYADSVPACVCCFRGCIA